MSLKRKTQHKSIPCKVQGKQSINYEIQYTTATISVIIILFRYHLVNDDKISNQTQKKNCYKRVGSHHKEYQ